MLCDLTWEEIQEGVREQERLDKEKAAAAGQVVEPEQEAA